MKTLAEQLRTVRKHIGRLIIQEATIVTAMIESGDYGDATVYRVKKNSKGYKVAARKGFTVIRVR